MNKTSITLFAFAFLLLAIASCSRNTLPNTSVSNATFVTNKEAPDNAVPRSQVNMKAARDFYELYGEGQIANWFNTAGGFIVSFKKDGIKTIIQYGRTGEKETCIKSYVEEKLPPAIRHIVKSNFYDYAITHITEIEENDVTAFYVNIQDNKTMKTIKVVDSEWEIVEDLGRL